MNKTSFTIFVLLLIIGFSVNVSAQNNTEFYESRVKRIVFPKYPMTAIAAGIRGDVKVEVEVDKNGELVETKILVGHKLLQKAVSQVISLWKFSTGTKSEKEIFTFTFSIIPQGVSNIEPTAAFEKPNKIFIYGMADKDANGTPPLLQNMKRKVN